MVERKIKAMITAERHPTIMPSDELSVESDAPSSSVALSSNTMARHVEIGRTVKVKQLRDDAVAVLEEMLATKMEEVGILQEQLALLSKQHVREAAMVDPYGDSGIFTGQINNEKPHGKGTMKYEDGRIFVGEWSEGRWHGMGRASFSNGDSYDGQYKYDQRHGEGCYRWHDGRVYTGGFYGDKRHGKGRYVWPDGAKYEGEFKDGQHDGVGTYRFADGSVYAGNWRQGQYHGVGTCTWSDGRIYTGEWHMGQAHGRGKETNPDGTIRHDGVWSYDTPVRKAIGAKLSFIAGRKPY